MTLKSPRFLARIQAELRRFQNDPPPGVSCWLDDQYNEDRLDRLVAEIRGPPDSPFASGIFTLDIELNERYPMEPPMVRFRTRIYHPNIDEAGRICLSLLKMPPKVSLNHWNMVTASNLATLLISIRLLMANPNPEDPLLADVAHEYINQRTIYTQKAAKFTQKYAIKSVNIRANMNDSTDVDNAACISTEHDQSADIAVELDEKKENIIIDTEMTSDIASVAMVNSSSSSMLANNDCHDKGQSVSVVVTDTNEDESTDTSAAKRPLVDDIRTKSTINDRMKLLKTNRSLRVTNVNIISSTTTSTPSSAITDSIERSIHVHATPTRTKGANHHCNSPKSIVKPTKRTTSVRSSVKKTIVTQTTSPFFATTTPCKSSLKVTNKNVSTTNSSNNNNNDDDDA
ncbi:ubiquitin-conjugating enzyme/RWD-like protein [Syncephalis plumigaleata]|nr:ubiquitin-conjugating enzyme/RWD-like protein [Syncephalis plumigaleata]